ncbi:MAG: GNAT family N-acetyltransferase [Terracidiphilus sp.]
MSDAPTLRTRPATAADIPALVELINAAFGIEEFLEGTRTDPDRLAATMAKGELLVAEEAGGELLASVYLEPRGERGYLGMLAVRPERQGQGLASAVIRAAEDRLRSLGCTVVEISVLSMRPELLPLYRRYGYVETGTEPFAFSRPLKPGVECHCIVMSKPL